MPLVKQTGVGASRNLNILCDVFLLSTILMGILLTAPGCCAKIETQIKLLNEEYAIPTRIGNKEAASSSSPSFSSSSSSSTTDAHHQQTAPHYNLYQDDLKRISYETIHRILRDENEPMIYRTNDLHYFQKRSSSSASHNHHSITKRSIASTPSMISLNLTRSNLRTFSLEAINSTHSLIDITSIILHNNSLTEFPLTAMPNLIQLDLSANNFTDFEVPPENSQLRVVNLNQNHIVSFTTSPTASVNSTLENKLHELHLKDNAIHWLGLLNLSQLNELEVLDLSCNQLENLETAFFPTRMKNLKYLNLARNRLQCIYRETFYNLLSMNTLILSYNDITEIDYETFLALPNLQYLDLSHNRLKGDSIKALQGIPDLVGLSIAYNQELGDSMQEFVASWSLKELDASGTGLCKIPAALAQSVRTLKLSDNWLRIINCGDLDSYPLLQYLDLSHSHIDDIEEDALGRLEILETLFLDHNYLKRIPISLPTSLEHLFLHDNQIMDIQPQSFLGLNNLKTLDLSANKLLYLPDLPLPKLLTLNLQSSGISGLHQAIVTTSPHLRDLYLEDNPIKCADLLGIAEWASPCRNDRRITKRINIKSHYVRMHNYFERFQCGLDANECAICITDAATQTGLPRDDNENDATHKPNCLEVNGLGKPLKPITTKEKLSHERKNNKQLQDTTTAVRAPTTTIIPSARTMNEEFIATKRTRTTTDGNQDEPKTTKETNAPKKNLPKIPAAQPEASAPATFTTTTTTTGPTSTISTTTAAAQTNSVDKALPMPQQKQLAAKSSSASSQSDNNYSETSAGTSTAPTPQPVSSLLSQENAGKSQKGFDAQSDNATEIEHGINGEISVRTTAAKSNLPTTARPKVVETITQSTTSVGRQISSERVPNKLYEEHHNKIQDILHTKDRHLIGTPLLMHKGHVILIPSVPISTRTQTTSSTMPTTMTTSTSNENLLLLAPRQNTTEADIHSTNTSTTITTSKGHKLETAVDTHPQYNHPYYYQSGSNENAIIKDTKKKMTNSPLGQENHYQDIQQTQQQHKSHIFLSPGKMSQQKPMTDRKINSTTLTVSTTLTSSTPPMSKDKNQRYDDNKEQFIDDNVALATERSKQFASNSKVTTELRSAQQQQHHIYNSHSLNTPLDGEISRRNTDDFFKQTIIEDGAHRNEDKSLAPTPSSSSTTHHSRVNTPLLKNDDDLQNLLPHAATSQNLHHESQMKSVMEGQTINQTNAVNASAALIKLETGPRTEAALSKQHRQQEQERAPERSHQNTVKSERWLDIRKATRHPGLVVVIGVTFAIVFIVGLVQVYRYRQKPLNYIGHRYCEYQHEHHHHQYEQQDSDYPDYKDHQSHHSHLYERQHQHPQHPHHHYFNHESKPDNSHCGSDGNNHNQCTNYSGCKDDRMQATSSSSSSSSYTSSPHHLLRIHENTTPISKYQIHREKCPSTGCASAASNSTHATSNYRLFQLSNGRRIKHNRHSSSSTSPMPPDADEHHDFYTEMNHGPQSTVLASDFFPMELLSAPSRIHSSSSTLPVPIASTTIASSHDTTTHRAITPAAPAASTLPLSLVSHLCGEQQHHSQQPNNRTLDDEYQGDNTATNRDRSKFDIW